MLCSSKGLFQSVVFEGFEEVCIGFCWLSVPFGFNVVVYCRFSRIPWFYSGCFEIVLWLSNDEFVSCNSMNVSIVGFESFCQVLSTGSEVNFNDHRLRGRTYFIFVDGYGKTLVYRKRFLHPLQVNKVSKTEQSWNGPQDRAKSVLKYLKGCFFPTKRNHLHRLSKDFRHVDPLRKKETHKVSSRSR